jgi:hypothetical protein
MTSSLLLAAKQPSPRRVAPPSDAPRVGARIEAKIEYVGTIEAYHYNYLSCRLEAEVRLTRYPHLTVRLPVGSPLHTVEMRELPSDENGTLPS